MQRRLPFVMTLVAVVFGSSALFAQEWTRFRGPNGSGMSDATTIPTVWTEKDYNWNIKIPGVGHSSPVLWGDRVFLTSGNTKTGERSVICINVLVGKILWQKRFPGEKHKKHRSNSYATATPTVDADRLYVTFGMPGKLLAVALDHDGDIDWQKAVDQFNGKHGHGVSPILHGGLLILANDQDKRGSLLALDAKTGAKKWEIPRNGKNLTYSTPCVYRAKGRAPQIIFTNWQHGVTAVDPQKGKISWELSVFEVDKKERAIASPLIAGDLILATCGFVTAQKHFVAVRPGDAAKKIAPQEVWRMEDQVSYLPTPIVKSDRIFLCTERGFARCLNAKTGNVIWTQRIENQFYASPICVGNNIYCSATDGEVRVFAAEDKFRAIARNFLEEPVYATPAVAGGRMYIRTHGHLISLGGKK